MRLDGEVDLVDGTKDLIDLADFCFIFKKDVCVEIGNFRIGGLVDHVARRRVNECSHFYKSLALVPPNDIVMDQRLLIPMIAAGGPDWKFP